MVTPPGPSSGVRDILSRVPFFQELTAAEIDRIASIGRVVPYQKDMVLFHEGDAGEAFYVVLAGAIRISKSVPGKGDQTLAFMEQGGFFGEMALVDDFPRSATAITQQDTLVLFIERRPLLEVFQVEPVIGRKVLWAFCRTLSIRLRETNDRIVALSAMTRPL
jgi:CRP-like cAMP-binding protein